MHVPVGFCVIADYTVQIAEPIVASLSRTRSNLKLFARRWTKCPIWSTSVRVTLPPPPSTPLQQPVKQTQPAATTSFCPVSCAHRTHLQFKLNAHKLVVFPNSAATATQFPYCNWTRSFSSPTVPRVPQSAVQIWQKCHLSYITNQVSNFPFRVHYIHTILQLLLKPKLQLADGNDIMELYHIQLLLYYSQLLSSCLSSAREGEREV